jgi:hypothetical protein
MLGADIALSLAASVGSRCTDPASKLWNVSTWLSGFRTGGYMLSVREPAAIPQVNVHINAC